MAAHQGRTAPAAKPNAFGHMQGRPERVQVMKQTIVLVIGLAVTLAGAIWATGSIWFESPETKLGFHGTFALILCALGILGLGGGLMALVFFSSRSGFDDEARH